MKQVVIFFVLFFSFMTGNYAAHTCVSNHKISYLPVQHYNDGFAHKSSSTISADIIPAVKDDYLVSLEDDDENEDNAKKLLSQSKYFVAITYSPNSRYRHSSTLPVRFASGRQVDHTSSCKYITHRSLRI